MADSVAANISEAMLSSSAPDNDGSPADACFSDLLAAKVASISEALKFPTNDPANTNGLAGASSSGLFDAENYDNDPQIALAWAGTAVEHMEIHFNLITSVPTEKLKLTNCDDEIYEAFLEEFPEFKLDVINAESLDSKENKQKWRKFIERFSDKVEDAKFGTLVRLDSSGEYTEENTKLVLRVQFLAIEIARNRKGLNEIARKKYGKPS